MASRGPLAGAARLFSTDRLDDMERRYKETVTLVKHGYLPRVSGFFLVCCRCLYSGYLLVNSLLWKITMLSIDIHRYIHFSNFSHTIASVKLPGLPEGKPYIVEFARNMSQSSVQ